MGKMSPDDERWFRENVKVDRAFIAQVFPEFACRPNEMRKMAEAIDLLIANWLRFRPETGEELKNFFAQQAAIVCNHYSQCVAAEFREYCEDLKKIFPNGTAEFIEMEKDGKKEVFESHLLDRLMLRRNFLAAYFGGELKCLDDYFSLDAPSVPEPS